MKKKSYILLICGLLACVMPVEMKAETVQERVQYLIDHANEATAGGVYDLRELVAPKNNVYVLTGNITKDAGKNKLYYSHFGKSPVPFTATCTLANMLHGTYNLSIHYRSYHSLAGTNPETKIKFADDITSSLTTGLDPGYKDYQKEQDLANGSFEIKIYSGSQPKKTGFYEYHYENIILKYTCPFYAVVKNFKTYDALASALTTEQQSLYATLTNSLRQTTLAGSLANGDRAPEIAEAYAIASSGNIVIENGKTMILDAPLTVTNLTVRSAAKLVVSAPITVTGDMTLEGGLYNAGANYSFAETTILSHGITVPEGHLKLVFSLNAERFYFLSLPCDVTRASITTSTGDAPYFFFYDGANRALHGKQNNWQQHNGTLLANQGYIVTLDDMDPSAINNITIPLSSDLVASPASDATIDVQAYGCKPDGSLDDNTHSIYDAGWNLIGTSYLSSYAATASSITVSDLAEVRSHKYITLPNWNNDGYTQKIITSESGTIMPFTPVFYQIATGTTMSFVSSALAAPARTMAQYEPSEEMLAEITLTAPDHSSDHFGVLLSNEATTSYNIGLDLTKMYGAEQPTLCYTLLGNEPLAYHALPLAAATSIPVAYKASVFGEYTFALRSSELPAVEHLYLIDNQEQTVTDLLYDDYTFTTAPLACTSRFSLSFVPEQEGVVTDLETMESSQTISVSAHGQHLCIYGLQAQNQVTVYDASGRLVNQQVASSAMMEMPLQPGMYVVRILAGNVISSCRIIVK